MWVYPTVLCVLLWAWRPLGSPVPSEQQERLERLYLEHVESLKPFSCRTPHATVFNSSDFLAETSSSLLVHPPQTVLGRCSNAAGCCKTYHACRPHRQELAERVFKLVNSFSGETSFVALRLENHLECLCQRTAGVRRPAATLGTDVTDPGSDVTTPEYDVTTPKNYVTDSGSDVTTPESDVTNPGSDVTNPGSDVTDPENDITTPE